MAAHHRSTKYIIVQYGMPYAADEMPPTFTRLSRLSIIEKTWEVEHVFDETSHYKYAVDGLMPITGLQRALAYTIYNPTVPVSSKWHRVGDYSAESLISAVEDGLQTDDDIIQQWFGAGQVLRLLSTAKSWSEMLLAVEAVGGSHEVFPDVQEYVERVLGKDA